MCRWASSWQLLGRVGLVCVGLGRAGLTKIASARGRLVRLVLELLVVVSTGWISFGIGLG